MTKAYMRCRSLLKKEFIQVLRDPSSIAIAFVMPVALLLLFGYGLSLDAKRVRVALVAEDPGPEAQSIISSFHNSEWFDPTLLPNRQRAVEAIRTGKVVAMVVLAENFAKSLKANRDAAIQLIVNGVDANTARMITGYVQATYQIWLNRQSKVHGLMNPAPVKLEHRLWFNPSVNSRHYLVPGLIAIIMTLIGALLTALVMAREWERGTLEALMVTPVSMSEILLGKIVPYFVLGMGGLALSVGMAIWLFDVPLRGSIIVLVVCSALFMLVAIGMGLFISVVTRNQFVAGMVGILVTFLPAFFLSGFLFDLGNMPDGVEAVTYIVAARYFVSILQTLFLAGNVWSVIIPNSIVLAMMAMIFLSLSRKKSKKQL